MSYFHARIHAAKKGSTHRIPIDIKPMALVGLPGKVRGRREVLPRVDPPDWKNRISNLWRILKLSCVWEEIFRWADGLYVEKRRTLPSVS